MKPTIIAAVILSAIPSVFAAEPTDLIRLYEEEILARDLYVALGKIHPEIRPFQNIPDSEARHREAMAGVLKAEGISLPIPPEGKRYVSDGLDDVFAKWLAEGTKSAVDACRVGARLEEHDIADLRKAQVDFPKQNETLAQLEAASNNHFRAFHRNLMTRSGQYTAEALGESAVLKILEGESTSGGCRGACGANGMGRRHRGGR